MCQEIEKIVQPGMGEVCTLVNEICEIGDRICCSRGGKQVQAGSGKVGVINQCQAEKRFGQGGQDRVAIRAALRCCVSVSRLAICA